MHCLSFLYSVVLVTSSLLSGSSALRSSANKVKLSEVQSLTLRKGLKTSHRRVSAIPQLKCIGGSAKSLYEVDVLRCTNSGSDYNREDIQWTCRASLPPEFKLGSTDVICEGYDSPDDPYILKGSCGVEYRLVLTSLGEKKYGRKNPWWNGGDDDQLRPRQTAGEKIFATLFFALFLGVAGWIVWGWFRTWRNNHPGALGRQPGWGGGGGGGGGGHGDDDDPPPPYDWRPSPSKPRYNYETNPATGQQGWRPGFWSGALGGAAAGWAANRAANWGNQDSSTRYGNINYGAGSDYGWDNGEGSSRRSSGSSFGTSARYESTGFGSTSRR